MRFACFLYLLIFISCDSRSTIKIKGSDTEVNLTAMLAESFHTSNKHILISVSGGGSGLGIASLINNTSDMANSSRRINREELEIFESLHKQVDSTIFAEDAIAFVISRKLPLDSISLSDLSKVLSGQISNWNILCRSNLPVTIYGRQSNSGTFEYIKSALDIRFAPQAKQMNGNAQILEAIKADATGIGYVGAGYVREESSSSIKVLKISGPKGSAVSPLDSAAVISGAYSFKRPLFQYYHKTDYQKLKPFLDFEKSATGKKIIHESGYYPVNQ